MLNKALEKVQHVGDAATSWTESLQSQYNERKGKVKAFVEIWMKMRFMQQAEILIEKIPEYIKKQLYDEYMPKCVEKGLHRGINTVWPDIKQEVVWEVAVMLDANQQQIDEKIDNDKGACCLRAFFRYHLYPYDKGTWQCLRDPIFILFNILCYVPYYGIWAWMFFVIFCIIDLRDEYQLVFFILSFKGCQFFSWGVIKGLVGFVQYFACVTFPDMSQVVPDLDLNRRQLLEGPNPKRCMESGPGMAEEYYILVLSWVVPLVLVWICMILLPFAKEKGRSQLNTLTESSNEETAAAQSDTPAGEKKSSVLDKSKGHDKSGGYLQRMLIFDLVIFLLCVGMLVLIVATQPHTKGDIDGKLETLLNADDWQVKQTFYCCQFIYGIFSIVFVPFQIPILQAVLTHSAPTAYDKAGRTRKFKGAKPPEPTEEEKLSRSKSILDKEQLDFFMNHLKTSLAGGTVRMEEMQAEMRNRASSLANVVQKDPEKVEAEV